jgi:AcrR family transcriptional regulator
MSPRGKRGLYHHGDLRATLIDTAIALIRQRGVHGFSLAEACRRAGVSVAAPYKHFANRDELLVAVAVRASDVLGATLATTLDKVRGPADRLAEAARTYVRFAAEQRPLFEALFAVGFEKHRYPEPERSSRPVAAAFFEPATTLAEGTAIDPMDLGLAAAAVAHGYAGLLLDGAFGREAGAVEVVAQRAATAARALVDGRRTFADTAPTAKRRSARKGDGHARKHRS